MGRLRANLGRVSDQHKSFNRLMILIALIFSASLSGCVGLTGAGTPAKTTSASTTGTLASSATALSFANVTVGSSAMQNLTLTNNGSAPVLISQATITGQGFSASTGMASVSIAAGQSRVFQIQFSPQGPGTVTGTISLNSNAINPTLSISLDGTAVPILAITGQPINQSVLAGQPATFNVGATGPGTLTYQWRKNGIAIAGATSPSYSTPTATISDSGALFSVLVGDGATTVTSNSATLTVTSAPVAPAITKQPSSQTIIAAQQATFSVAAAGTGTLTYQWMKNGSTIGGATSANYTTPATTASDSGTHFTVSVTNSVGNVTSNAATLTVNVPPAISGQPANQNVAAGQTATFSVTASGSGSLSYQWERDGNPISGGTSNSYTTPATTASDNGAQFTVTVTGIAGSAISNPATLTVQSPPTVTAQPLNQTVIAGKTATFSVTATGAGILTYQWNKNGSAISGATAPSYTTPATTSADNAAQFSVSIGSGMGSVSSRAAILTVTPATFVLNASQTSLNFSTVNTGSSSILGVTFTNAGNSNVTISSVSISGAGYSASGVSAGLILTPRQTATLNVSFAPATTGSLTGNVTVASNAATSPANISLSGTGAQAVQHSVTLDWVASTSTVAGYNVYRSSVSGGPYAKMNSSEVATTSFVDSVVQSGQTYFYTATSVDSSGNESVYSTEVTATIP